MLNLTDLERLSEEKDSRINEDSDDSGTSSGSSDDESLSLRKSNFHKSGLEDDEKEVEEEPLITVNSPEESASDTSDYVSGNLSPSPNDLGTIGRKRSNIDISNQEQIVSPTPSSESHQRDMT